MLIEMVILLAAAVIVVPLFKKLGLGAVLGYLIAGILIGPWGLRLITDIDSILHFSEFGVVLLLFIIGLELQPARLWLLRHSVFGLGTAQVVISTLVIAMAVYLFIPDWSVSLIIGIGAALSSTAFILQTLTERKELSTLHGRETFSVLLFQDLIVIPLFAVIPFIAGNSESINSGDGWYAVMRALIIISIMLAIGREVLRLIFRWVTYFGDRDIFTAAALLVVAGNALIMNYAGISMSLGAFLAGVLLADSEFRHQIEAEIEPFKSLLLGLFFIAVGMSVNLGLVAGMPVVLVGSAVLLILIKSLILFGICRLFGHENALARNLALTLAAGGEFAFVLFSLAGINNLLAPELVEKLVVIISLSMMASPLLIRLDDYIREWSSRNMEPEYDRIDEDANPVVIIGFGRVGQIISRILHMIGIRFTALENNPSQVDFVRRFGSKIYYGDATRLDLLEAARVGQARLVVLAINDIETSVKIAGLLRKHYPSLPIYARAHNRLHCYKLMDLGIKVLFRDTFYSSLKLANEILKGLDFSDEEARQTVDMFRAHDEALLYKQHAIYKDEAALIESVVKSRAELQTLFESDVTGNKQKIAGEGINAAADARSDK